MNYTPKELAQQLGSGLLSFPVTPFDSALAFDAGAYGEHLEFMTSFDVAGLFASGGTGEFFSLSNDEVRQTLRISVQAAGDKMPILGPAGGPVNNAIELAQIAEEEGAAGLLLFPPYLTESSQQGLVEYVNAIASSTKLAIIVYARANGIVLPEAMATIIAANENVIGYKDGTGSVEIMTKLYAQLGDSILYIGGLPTAETFALPYLELGVSTYSSAMFNFVPEFALGFHKDVLARNRESVYRKLNKFVLPYLDIRNRQEGYAVSIVKAGVTAIGRNGGLVRPPLTNLDDEERSMLKDLIEKI